MDSIFNSFDLHGLALANRVVMAPMTRSRAAADGVLSDLTPTYYAQRAGAGLIITEATAVSKQGSGYPNIPGIWSAAQIQGWKPVTQAVHEKNGKIFMQLIHTGRIGHSSLTGCLPVSASDIPAQGQVMAADYSMQPYETPRALAPDDIAEVIGQFGQAARNAKDAGFDGVEIHAANGYLIDQFLRDGVNKRDDSYGGSADNRARLLREVTAAAIESFGPYRVGVRLSPYNAFNTMSDSDPLKTFTRAAELLNDYPLAYLHTVEASDAARPSVTGAIRKIYKGVLIANEGLTASSAQSLVGTGQADLVCFGRAFIANPDLVDRMRGNFPLTDPDPATFYGGDAKGYTDYPAYAATKV